MRCVTKARGGSERGGPNRWAKDKGREVVEVVVGVEKLGGTAHFHFFKDKKIGGGSLSCWVFSFLDPSLLPSFLPPPPPLSVIVVTVAPISFFF